MKPSRLPTLLLALALQVLPVSRVFFTATPAAGSSFAYVSTWLAGLGALLGSYNAVSGASTAITSATTATATNGVVFSYRVTTGPDAANWFSASNLPPGLVISTTVGRITGIPTTNGVYVVRLTASDNQRPDRTVTANLTLTVKPPGGGVPVITVQLQSARVVEGSGLTMAVTATGPAQLHYQWRKNGSVMVGVTNASFTIAAVSTNDAGTYGVAVASTFGTVVGSNAVVNVVPLPKFNAFHAHGELLDLSFVRQPGAAYEVQFKDIAQGVTWHSMTNWPAIAAAASTTVSASRSEAEARLYQIKMTLP